ncbi:hypothetical protein [Nostocoides veronense]|uniref:Aldolase n=1 Tax=Nostocoides veronense TaxID=330836 RepID=A0ABN2LS78_9MICO
MTTTPDVGLQRRLSRICDRDGLIRTAAIDHPENYDLLFDADLSRVDFAEVVDSKLELIAAMSGHASSLLLDPRSSVGQAIVSGAVPGDVGILSGLEALYYQPDSGGFEPRLALKEGWGPERLADLGIDAAKLVVFHRHLDEDAVAEKVAIVSDVARRCHDLHLPLVVEPLWYPAAGEDPTDPAIRAQRTESVISSAAIFKAAGADIMKVEFPVDLAAQGEQADAATARLAEACAGTWVLLSAGVTFDGFLQQVEVGVRHGCSGFMAGRAIWGDGVGRFDADRRAAGVRTACERLDKLTDVLHRRPNPAYTSVPRDAAPAVIGPDWYHG